MDNKYYQSKSYLANIYQDSFVFRFVKGQHRVNLPAVDLPIIKDQVAGNALNTNLFILHQSGLEPILQDPELPLPFNPQTTIQEIGGVGASIILIDVDEDQALQFSA